MYMTELSKSMKDKALSIDSVDEAKKELLEGCHFRKFKDTLIKFCEINHIAQTQIIDELILQKPDMDQASVRRNVTNWFNGKNRNINKNTAFSLCLILKLNLDQSDEFLNAAADEGFRWRNPKDIVWAYGIYNNYTYNAIMQLLHDVDDIYKQALKQNKNNSNVYTETVFNKISPLLESSEKVFLEGLKECMPELGSYHNNAYNLFEHFWEILIYAGKKPDSTDKKKRPKYVNRKMFIREVLEEYFASKAFNHSNKDKDKDEDKDNKNRKVLLSNMEKYLIKDWPNEESIGKIKNRRMDVPRKLLIILFLVTNGYDTVYDDDDVLNDEEDLTKEEVFNNIYIRLNLMLKNCGYRLIDPRDPFDWLILYCISVDDVCLIDHRFSDILFSIYSELESEPEDENNKKGEHE